MVIQRERVNDMIRISPVRVIGPENEQLGVLDLDEAKRRAREAGLDLVEISPDSRPPVCRIMDFGRYKYEKSKKEHKARSGSKKSELKELRLGRSMRIDPHDIELRLNQAREFLMEGHKVQFIQPFQGREMQHKQLGYDRMKDIENQLADIAKVEMTPRFNGRRMIMTLVPDRAKIQLIKQREGQQQAREAKAPTEAPTDDHADAPEPADAPEVEAVEHEESRAG